MIIGEMLDTSPEQRRRYTEMVRALTLDERARKVAGLSAAARELARAGIRQRHPESSDAELPRLLAELLYGADFARRVYRRP